jgi:hypothetical protein
MTLGFPIWFLVGTLVPGRIRPAIGVLDARLRDASESNEAIFTLLRICPHEVVVPDNWHDLSLLPQVRQRKPFGSRLLVNNQTHWCARRTEVRDHPIGSQTTRFPNDEHASKLGIQVVSNLGIETFY